jgi:riboflavin biosynthesis pyrimidine reductase
MKPKVSLLCMVSQDAGYISKDFDMQLYYEAGYKLGADAVIAGADTMLEGLTGFGDSPCIETGPPKKAKDPELPWLVITDSKGRMISLLGHYREMEFVRDVIVLVASSTPTEYVEYLKKYGYRYISAGRQRCDLTECLEGLRNSINIQHLRVDSVGSLATAFLNECLSDEITMIYSPIITKSPSPRAFDGLKRDIGLSLISTDTLRHGNIMATFTIMK